LLAGAEEMNLGFVSRLSVKDSFHHVILGSQFYNAKQFATQINLNQKNMWAILRYIIALCMKQPQGKYVLLKDPNKPVVRLYSVPAQDNFEDIGGGDEEGDEPEPEERRWAQSDEGPSQEQ